MSRAALLAPRARAHRPRMNAHRDQERSSADPTATALAIAPRLIDERSRPGFRELFGRLARRATGLDVALTHLRLSTLDLSERELASVRRIRLLLAEVSAVSLDAEAHALLHRAPTATNLRRLAALLALGTIEVRSAPLGGWAPDFSIFRTDEGPCAALIGPHRFDRGPGHEGPVLASLHGAGDAARLEARFADIWGRGHDIRPAIAGILARAQRRSPTTTAATTSARASTRDSVDTPRTRG
jgi:hypothetical protein